MTPSEAPVKEISDPEVVVQSLEREWRRMRLSPAERRELVSEVTADLSAAAADGVSPAIMLGADLPRFAREAAQARGYAPVPTDYRRALLGGVLGALIALFVGYVLVNVAYRLVTDQLGLLWGALLVTCLLGTLGGLARALGHRYAARATVVRAAVLVPLVPLALAVALVVGPPPSSYVAVGLVLGGWVAAIAAARWWALRG
ncbi:MAG TPA: hypothetical protein VGD09_00765 [Blastococcus sp.]